jgi:hypothetical protein
LTIGTVGHPGSIWWNSIYGRKLFG